VGDAAVKIGYSFWGFLGAGIIDTPDGGRSHRRRLLDGLRGCGHRLILLQANRDLVEAGDDLRGMYRWDAGLPDLDVLFLEWRWPIPGRNTTACGTAGHTCDLHRQQQLVERYTIVRHTPTMLWDKDRQLPAGDAIRGLGNVQVLEAALHPSRGARSLLFPVADEALDQPRRQPDELARMPRDLPLVYIGNQYDRDDAFDRYFAPAAAQVAHRVAGKWTRTDRWPHVNFTGRIPFPDIQPLYRRTLAAVLLLPDRYARAGQMTQRLFEAVLAGCLPIAPATVRSVDRFAPASLQAGDGQAVLRVLRRLTGIARTPSHADLIGQCLQRLDPFRLSRQLDAIDEVIRGLA
jgi:hypothetical protein